MKVKHCFILCLLLLTSIKVDASSIEELKQASMATAKLQSELSQAQTNNAEVVAINSLRNLLQQAKAKELALYQALVQIKAESDYNQALAAQNIIVEASSDCERIESDKECLLKAEQAALALAAKQGGHYFIEALSEQQNQREQNKGKIETSVQFNETVSMTVKAHVLGFKTLKQGIERSPFTSNRQAVVKLQAQVAGQQNSALKQSLTEQAQALYKPYLSSKELTRLSHYNLLELTQLGIELVELPSGNFKFGSQQGDRNETPQHIARVASFYLSRLEVTKQVYNQCIKALVCSRELYEGDLLQPAVDVSWLEITEEFLPWVSNVTGYQMRLPTEREWEYASKIGKVNAQLCTLGNGNFKFTPCDDEFEKLAPVGMFKANKHGIYDLIGNAAEWTNSCWRYDHSKKARTQCNKAVIKGGSWYNKAYYLRPSARFGKSKSSKLDTLGFRLAMSNESALIR